MAARMADPGLGATVLRRCRSFQQVATMAAASNQPANSGHGAGSQRQPAPAAQIQISKAIHWRRAGHILAARAQTSTTNAANAAAAHRNTECRATRIVAPGPFTDSQYTPRARSAGTAGSSVRLASSRETVLQRPIGTFSAGKHHTFRKAEIGHGNRGSTARNSVTKPPTGHGVR
jgi:hypothetical protein